MTKSALTLENQGSGVKEWAEVNGGSTSFDETEMDRKREAKVRRGPGLFPSLSDFEQTDDIEITSTEKSTWLKSGKDELEPGTSVG